MASPTGTDINRLSRIATGRDASVFEADLAASHDVLREAVEGRRILVIGGAGTIGSATTALIADWCPAALHIVDQSENGLAELVRHLRSRPEGLTTEDLRTFPIDYGASVMRLVLDQGGYDAILNFAALKHVRSERDVPSLLQMLDTNLLKNKRLMQELARRGFKGRYFCVSTDKAANPVSLMGASKRVMEHLIFSGMVVPEFDALVTSTRFANVAFSDGSLLCSFIQRFAKRQPIAVPVETQRYFVSPRESGEICALAAFCVPAGTIVVPDFASKIHLVYLEDVACGFVRAQGLEPAFYADEAAARQVVEQDLRAGRYPVLRTPLDTSGEKPYEEFVGSGEEQRQIGFAALAAVTYAPPDRAALTRLFDLLGVAVADLEASTKADVVSAIAAVVPEFCHRETGRHLDQRI